MWGVVKSITDVHRCSHCHGANYFPFTFQGMLSSRGRLLLFADADGATKFADFEKLETEIKKIKETNEVCISNDRFNITFDKFSHLIDIWVYNRINPSFSWCRIWDVRITTYIQ